MAGNLTPRKRTTTKPGKRGRPIDVAARQRQQKALQLRLEGHSYAEIMALTGYASSGAVANAIKACLERQEHGDVVTYRDLHRARLSRLLQAVWGPAVSGSLPAMDRAVKVLEQLAKLDGLNLPPRLEVSGPGGGPIQSTVNVIAWQPDEAWISQFAEAWSEVTDADVKYVGPGTAAP